MIKIFVTILHQVCRLHLKSRVLYILQHFSLELQVKGYKLSKRWHIWHNGNDNDIWYSCHVFCTSSNTSHYNCKLIKGWRNRRHQTHILYMIVVMFFEGQCRESAIGRVCLWRRWNSRWRDLGADEEQDKVRLLSNTMLPCHADEEQDKVTNTKIYC